MSALLSLRAPEGSEYTQTQPPPHGTHRIHHLRALLIHVLTAEAEAIMGKLHMKRTPTEQAEHDLRKARKAARRAAKHARRHTSISDDDSAGPSSRKRPRTDDLSDSESPSHRGHKPDYDYVRAQVEEERFREKMWGAYGEDERLDGVEASFNSYAHIPRRWRGGGMDRMDDELDIDPQMMEEEDYAEWVRDGMWKYVHSFITLNDFLVDAPLLDVSMQTNMRSRSARKQSAQHATLALKLSGTRRNVWRKRKKSVSVGDGRNATSSGLRMFLASIGSPLATRASRPAV